MHNYIGMNIYFTYNRKINFIMIDYIINILKELPYDMKGEASPAAREQIFVVNEENPTKVSEKYTVMFCHNTTKLLFLENKVRPDIQLSVSFLWKRAKELDAYGYNNILSLILGMDNIVSMICYIYWAFTIHNKMKIHTE